MFENSEPDSVPNGWRVSKIEVVRDGRAVEVEFTIEGRSPFRFRTRKFGVGRRNARTANLARFAARAGFGDVKAIFEYLSRMRRDHEGDVFPLSVEQDADDTSGWSAVSLYPEYYSKLE